MRLLSTVAVLGSIVLTAGAAPAAGADRPNILWITCEDTSPLLGCYGDQLARTPVLDELAARSVRYVNAFAYTGVCAPSRSCLITGAYPPRLGSQGMRSTTALPPPVKCFPEYLRAAGYYCSNNQKTDYNFPTPRSAWDESGKAPHWRRRAKDQPFFSVFNLMVTHQSYIFSPEQQAAKTGRPVPPTRTDPARVTIPPIHPDTPEFRTDWARHYDNVATMDGQVGRILAELRADGLDETTIVFFFSDHGTGMPSIKGSVWDVSLRVPLLVHFPPRYRHLVPAEPGGTTDRLVSFVDFAPTVLGLANVPAGGEFQGAPFLGGRAAPPRRFVYGGRDRMGERFDCVRYVHDGRYHYLRNFMPHLPHGQFSSYNDQLASMRAWQRLHDAGTLTGGPARFFRPKPVEELYDVRADPWELNNLADDPAHRGSLEAMRAECRDWMLRVGDTGLLPEYELRTRSEGTTPWAIALDPAKNPLADLLAAADVANRRDPASAEQLVGLLGSGDSATRWWAVVGLATCGDRSAATGAALRRALNDPAPSVRIAAAEAVAALGHAADALPVLEAALGHPSALVRLEALNALDRLGPAARPAVAAVRAAKVEDPEQRDVANYVGRMAEYMPGRIGG